MTFCATKDIRRLVVLLFISIFPGFLASQDKAPPVVYDASVRIEPDNGYIFARANVRFRLVTLTARDFKFNLHETFRINKLLINGKEASFTSAPNASRLTPTAKAITVTLPQAISGGQIKMDIEYEGKLKELPEWGATPNQTLALDDQINSLMIELAGYSSWHPQFVFGDPIEAHLELSLPKGWVSICSGAKLEERVQDGRIISKWYSPRDLDIVIAASPNYKTQTAKQSNVAIAIYHTQMPRDFIAHEMEQIGGAVRFYTEKLGETNIPGGIVRQVYSPKRYGQGKAGIARPGLFVTSEGLTLDSISHDPSFSLFQPISHEIAHFWWNFGVGQGDWINEAFAEYFSALAIRNASGEKAFQVVLNDYRKQAAELPPDAPPLSTVPFVNDNVGFVVRYYKGSMMLDEIRQQLGDVEFFRACRGFFQAYTGKAVGTAEFRSFWRNKLVRQAKLLDFWLDSTGGLPSFQKRPTTDSDRSWLQIPSWPGKAFVGEPKC